MNAYYPISALERAMKVQEVILRAMSGEIHWIDAAEILGISDRQMRRWKRRYEIYGYDGLYDRRRKYPSPRRVALEKAEKVLRLYREKYFDFNMSHFYDKLTKHHDIHLSYNWVRLALEGAGLVEKRNRRDPHRKRRPRKPLVGMMLHMDGSPHDWFGNGAEYDIVTISDDASNEVYDIALVDEEDSHTCMEMIRNTVEKKGIFCSLYSDRASHFFLTKKAGEEVSKDNLTQVGRALAEIGTQHIPSYSPQARGRSERLNRTYQGRIPQELRLRGIKTKEEANKYLRTEYLREHNKRFAVKPEKAGSAFIPVPKTMDLDKIFCFKHERTVNNDNTVSYNNRILQVGPSELRISFAKCRVMVYEHLDGSITVGYGPHMIGYYPPKDLSTNSQYSQKEKVAKRKRATTNINQKRTDHLLEKADILTI
ncbi:MAG: ISNCY family transposase [Candidatus Omnitrophica bacterium]|nr:ISNCY family transposase [Candidatus Omnitrophota bacterium]